MTISAVQAFLAVVISRVNAGRDACRNSVAHRTFVPFSVHLPTNQSMRSSFLEAHVDRNQAGATMEPLRENVLSIDKTPAGQLDEKLSTKIESPADGPLMVGEHVVEKLLFGEEKPPLGVDHIVNPQGHFLGESTGVVYKLKGSDYVVKLVDQVQMPLPLEQNNFTFKTIMDQHYTQLGNEYLALKEIHRLKAEGRLHIEAPQAFLVAAALDSGTARFGMMIDFVDGLNLIQLSEKFPDIYESLIGSDFRGPLTQMLKSFWELREEVMFEDFKRSNFMYRREDGTIHAVDLIFAGSSPDIIEEWKTERVKRADITWQRADTTWTEVFDEIQDYLDEDAGAEFSDETVKKALLCQYAYGTLLEYDCGGGGGASESFFRSVNDTETAVTRFWREVVCESMPDCCESGLLCEVRERHDFLDWSPEEEPNERLESRRAAVF